ncbi:hypothetical protein [Salipiger mucosus]|nr:hypothetical protein [Salipiger mucosus]
MNIGFSPELLGIGFAFFLLWLGLSWLYLPRLRRRALAAEPGDLARMNRRLAGAGALRDIALAGVIAFAIVLLGLLALNLHVSAVGNTDSDLLGLMALRQQAQTVLDQVQTASLSLWGASIAVIGLIWMVVSRRRAGERWDTALEARRAALRAQADALDMVALRAAAEEVDPRITAGVDERAEALTGQARKTVETMLAAQILTFKDNSEQPMSLLDLAGIRAQLEARAGQAEAEGQGEEATRLREAAEGIGQQLGKLKADFPLELEGMTGPVTTTLARAEVDPEGIVAPEAARRAALADRLVEHRLRNHLAEGRSRAGAEPEDLRGWILAGGTSEAVTKGAGGLGRAARHAAVIAFLLGFVGLGTNALGAGVTASLKEAELGLAGRLSAQSVQTAAARTEAPAEADASDLASDEATTTMLRASMRASFARAVQAGVAPRGPGPVFGPRQRFDLAAVNARQRILAVSARPAAAAVGAANAQGGAAYTVHASHANTNAPPIDAILDPPVDRRIAQLRQNERVWTSLRAAAARPVAPDLAAEQFLRVAFADEAMLRSHQVQLLADRVTADVARTAARTGTIPHGYAPEVRADFVLEAMSDRDRRIITDFESRSAGRAGRYVDDVRTGRIDPGSLHRSAPGSPLRPGGGGAGASAYGDLFPAVLDNAAGAGGGGGGGPSRTASASGKSRVAAKSYRAVRFNRRVGGVVIGRSPEGGDAADITGFDWAMRDGGLTLVLTTREGGRHEMGPFDPAIAHHALSYAADGRVVAATLPLFAAEDAPLEVPTRRVVVHPAFEDTRFACSAIQIDRFVDAVMFDEANTAAEPLRVARNAVTGFGQILRYAGPEDNTPAILDQLGPDMRGAFDHARSCGTGASCFPLETYAGYGMRFGGAGRLLSCFTEAAGPEACGRHLTGLYSETTYSVDSGVREVPYEVDPGLGFLTGEGAEGPLWPLDFIVQAVPEALSREEMAISEDWEPWIFPSFANELRGMVARAVALNPGAAEVLDEMRQFTVLQRLFRAALDGHLGLEFPFAALVPLQEATAESVVIERQEHWNHNQPFFDFMMRQDAWLRDGFARALQSAAPQGACRQALEAAAGAEGWPDAPGHWPRIAAVEAACSASEVPGLAARIADLRDLGLIEEAIQLRASLGRPRAALSCAD